MPPFYQRGVTMITWKDDKTFVDSGRIFEVDKKNDDGSMIAHLIGFEDRGKLAAYNETSDMPLPPLEEVEEIKEEVKEEIEEITEPPKFICQYCGRECLAKIGLIGHEKACPENPVNKKGEIDG